MKFLLIIILIFAVSGCCACLKQLIVLPSPYPTQVELKQEAREIKQEAREETNAKK